MTFATKMKSRRLSFWSGILLFLNVIFILILVAGFLAAYVPPDKNWMFAFAGLIFPYTILINLLFVIFWIVIGRKLFIISLILLLLCWNRIAGYVQLGFDRKSPASNEKVYKVISYNVQIFDLYNWKDNKMSSKAHQILSFLKEEHPEFLCLQEYHAGKKNIIDISDSIQAMTGMKYSQVALVRKKGKIMPYGIATFSKWPIIKRKVIDFDGNPANFCIYSDILIDKDTIRLFNVHLESIKLSNEDYLYVTELPKNPESQENFKKNSRKILRKFKNAYIKRAPQARKISNLINESPYPVIICGDFNDTPSSYTYHKVSDNLLDAFRESGKGIGITYAGSLPSFRIDYILHDSFFKSVNYETIKNDYSDHYPITTGIIIH